MNTEIPIKKTSLIDRDKFICTSGDKLVILWNLKGNLCEKYYHSEESVYQLLHFNAQHFITGHKAKIRIWDYQYNESIKVQLCHNNWVDVLAKLSNKEFATASTDAVIKIWEFQTLTLLKQISLNNDSIVH